MEVAAILASSRAQSAILNPAAKTPLGGVCSLSVTPSKLHFAAELWGKPSRAVLCCAVGASDWRVKCGPQDGEKLLVTVKNAFIHWTCGCFSQVPQRKRGRVWMMRVCFVEEHFFKNPKLHK